MKIALIAPPWIPVPPPAYGGIEAAIDRLARGLDEAGHEVLLFGTGDSTCPVPTAWVLEEAEGSRFGFATVELRHVLHAYAATKGFDVIHDHTIVGPLLGALSSDALVVTTAHSDINGEQRDVYRAVSERVPIIAVSHHQARSSSVPIASVIQHGIDTSAFTPGPGDGGYLLFLGRMDVRKGVDQAVRIAREASVPLKIAAKMRDDEERRFFEERVEPMLGDGIEYVGEASKAERLELLQNARALLNPIAWPEPFGLVMVEALACGTPVLAHGNGAAPEIVDHGVTGWLSDDERGLAESIGRIGEFDRAACRLAAVERFSQERMVRQHIEFYRRAIAERRPRTSHPSARRGRRRKVVAIPVDPGLRAPGDVPAPSSPTRHRH